MLPVSVVIIAKNERKNISDCIHSARQITDDIIVVDSGSTDETLILAEKGGARVISVSWQGYGPARNAGAGVALNDWIFSLDADERISSSMASQMMKLDFKQTRFTYRFKRVNYFGDRVLHFGHAGFDRPCRLYNRKVTAWDLSKVHEELLIPKRQRKVLHGCHLIHYAIESESLHREKLRHYAVLCARKYFDGGKTTNRLLNFLSPVFNTVKSYIFLGGFLDGVKGFQMARLTAFYCRRKYEILHRLLQAKKYMEKPPPVCGMVVSKPSA